MKDWKETIREVMTNEIANEQHVFNRLSDAQRAYHNPFRLASLRNALDQFEKVVKEKPEVHPATCACDYVCLDRLKDGEICKGLPHHIY